MEYASKQELLEEIKKQADLFIGEFDDISEEAKDRSVEGVDRTPAQMIAYQLGWMQLVVGWDRDELAGKEVVMPAPGYKWNQLDGMYQSFYSDYAHCTLGELRWLFSEVVRQWCDWVADLSDAELFIQGHRKWTGEKINWPMARWIHINSVAPFKTFRGKAREWKKMVNSSVLYN